MTATNRTASTIAQRNARAQLEQAVQAKAVGICKRAREAGLTCLEACDKVRANLINLNDEQGTLQLQAVELIERRSPKVFITRNAKVIDVKYHRNFAVHEHIDHPLVRITDYELRCMTLAQLDTAKAELRKLIAQALAPQAPAKPKRTRKAQPAAVAA